MVLNQLSNPMVASVLVTGATGFIGRALVEDFAKRPSVVLRSAVRCQGDASRSVNAVVVGDLSRETDWASAVDGMNCVVHTAAQVAPTHRGKPTTSNVYRRVNVQGTLKLAEQAAAAGVRRFVFISTAKVLGERSTIGRALPEFAPYGPCDGYAISKMEAELALLAMAKHTEMEIVIVRPPMVYGTNAKGNFKALIRLLDLGIPLPLAGIKNMRSFLSIDNLVDFVWTCMWHPAAASQIFHVCDAKDLAIPELIRAIEKSMHRPAYLFQFPELVLKVGCGLLGRMDTYHRLYDNLQLDASKAKVVMHWHPLVSLEETFMRLKPERKN